MPLQFTRLIEYFCDLMRYGDAEELLRWWDIISMVNCTT
jgi:hypothetical protein